MNHLSANSRRLRNSNNFVPYKQRDGCWKCVHAKPSFERLYCEVNRCEVAKMDVCSKLFREERHVRNSVSPVVIHFRARTDPRPA